jgi:hypothetical protein
MLQGIILQKLFFLKLVLDLLFLYAHDVDEMWKLA